MLVSPDHIRRLDFAERVRLAIEILATYARVRWLLHSRNPPEAVQSLRQYARRHRISSEPSEILIGWRLGHAVNVTLRPLPTDVRCLFRSLTLLSLMERRDMHPKLVISVRSQPFAAHAWVELDGQPLLRDADADHQRLLEI